MKNLISLISFLMIVSSFAQEEAQDLSEVHTVEVYIGDKKFTGTEVLYKSGKVQLSTGKGSGLNNYDIDKVSKIVSPKPMKVRQMETAFAVGNFVAVAAPAGEAVVEEYRFLGWGKRAAFLYGYALYRTGKLNEAQNIFSKAQGHIRGVEDDLDTQLLIIGMAALDVANKKLSSAKTQLKKISGKLLPETKSYFYNIEGDILMQEGDDTQAVLSFYKALLLDDSNPYEKGYAVSKIQSIYKKLNDPRVEQIKNLTK